MSSDSSVNSSSFTFPVLKPTENQPKKDAEPESEFASYKNGILKIKIGENEFRKVKITKIGGKEITPDSLKGERLQAIIDVFKKFIENETTKHVLASKDLTHYKASYDTPSSTATLHGAPEVPLQDVEAQIVEKSEDKPIGELFNKIIREPAEKVAEAEHVDEKETKDQEEAKEREVSTNVIAEKLSPKSIREDSEIDLNAVHGNLPSPNPVTSKGKKRQVRFTNASNASKRTASQPDLIPHQTKAIQPVPLHAHSAPDLKRRKTMSHSMRNLLSPKTTEQPKSVMTPLKRATSFFFKRTKSNESLDFSPAPRAVFINKLKSNVQGKMEADEKSMVADSPIDKAKIRATISGSITYQEIKDLILAFKKEGKQPDEVRTELLKAIQEAVSNTNLEEPTKILHYLIEQFQSEAISDKTENESEKLFTLSVILYPIVLDSILTAKHNNSDISSGKVMVKVLDEITHDLNTARFSHPEHSNTCEAAILLDHLLLQAINASPVTLEKDDLALLQQIRIFNIGNKPNSYKEWKREIGRYLDLVERTSGDFNKILNLVPSAANRKVLIEASPNFNKRKKIAVQTLMEGLVLEHKKVSKTTLCSLLDKQSRRYMSLIEQHRTRIRRANPFSGNEDGISDSELEDLKKGIRTYMEPLLGIYDLELGKQELPFAINEQLTIVKDITGMSSSWKLDHDNIFKSIEDFLFEHWTDVCKYNIHRFLAMDTEAIIQLRSVINYKKSAETRIETNFSIDKTPLGIRQIQLLDVIIFKLKFANNVEVQELDKLQSELSVLKQDWFHSQNKEINKQIHAKIENINFIKQRILEVYAKEKQKDVPPEQALKEDRILNLILMDYTESDKELSRLRDLEPKPEDEIAILQYKICQIHEIPSQAIIRLISKR